MKHSRTIIGIIAFCAAVFLVGCGEQPVSETSSSSVETSTSSVETSSSSAESSASSSDLNIENPMDINDVLNPELNTIDTSKPIKTEGSSSNSSSEPTTSSDTSSSEPTSDTHEPTSEPTSSSQPTTSQPTSQPTSSSSNSGTTSSSSSSGGTSSSSSTTSKPTSSSSSSGGNTSTPTSPYWNPDAPGNTPGPYGGYYDASGTLHVLKANMPKDSEGYPLKSYTDEVGQPRLNKAEKEAWDAETERIDNGGDVDTSGLDGSKWGFEF